jgi:hypothetical protein
MPIIDNRPEAGSGGGGGGITLDDAKNGVKAEWKVEFLSIGALDLSNGYKDAAFAFQNSQVGVALLGVGPLQIAEDYTLDIALGRVSFEADLLSMMTDAFNKYGALALRLSYFKKT